MAEELFPVFDVPEFVDADTEYDRTYRKSIAWDIETGDFVRDGSNRLVCCEGYEAYRIWCFKNVHTERFRCLSYDNEIGVEMEEALKEDTNEAVESAIERTITEALMANPRTESVEDFSFSWDGDTVTCNFYVKGIEMDRFPLTITG